jgi:thymidylate synthase ThyX
MKEEDLSKRDARKRAKECARFYLPYGNQLTCDVMFNFRSFMHFAGLRYNIHSQREICKLAEKMIVQVVNAGNFTMSLKAFGLLDAAGNLTKPFEK